MPGRSALTRSASPSSITSTRGWNTLGTEVAEPSVHLERTAQGFLHEG